MRLWSIHPKYLDQKGLTSLWREGLLAQKVLRGETKGYRNHSQLNRFKNESKEVMQELIGFYLLEVWLEAKKRGYSYNVDKIVYGRTKPPFKIKVSSAQFVYEWNHLQKKLTIRDLDKFDSNERSSSGQILQTHPLFEVYESDKLEEWEKLK